MLKTRPGSVIVDGNRFKPYNNVQHTCFVKGDGRYASIAAASVLAKTHRDEYMRQIAKEFPQYGWEEIWPTLRVSTGRPLSFLDLANITECHSDFLKSPNFKLRIVPDCIAAKGKE